MSRSDYEPCAWGQGRSESESTISSGHGSDSSSVSLEAITAGSFINDGPRPGNHAVVSTPSSSGKTRPATVWYTVPINGRGAVSPHRPRSEHVGTLHMRVHTVAESYHWISRNNVWVPRISTALGKAISNRITSYAQSIGFCSFFHE